MKIAFVTAASFLLAATAAEACFSGRPDPVNVTFAGKTINLIGSDVVKGSTIAGDVLIADVADVAPAASESFARVITLRRGSMQKVFRVAYPPLARGGCNQPRLTN